MYRIYVLCVCTCIFTYNICSFFFPSGRKLYDSDRPLTGSTTVTHIVNILLWYIYFFPPNATERTSKQKRLVFCFVLETTGLGGDGSGGVTYRFYTRTEFRARWALMAARHRALKRGSCISQMSISVFIFSSYLFSSFSVRITVARKSTLLK